MAFDCFDDPSAIYDKDFCISALSKDLEGEVRKLKDQDKKCTNPPCKTLRTLHTLKVTVAKHPSCDGPLGKYFDDTFVVEELATAFEDDGHSRGIHSGDFIWVGVGGLEARGRISGITNAGTHRRPVFDPCQKCHDPGYMEGRICGVVTQPPIPELEECQILGTYRFRFDPSRRFQNTAIWGTIEAELICPCR